MVDNSKATIHTLIRRSRIIELRQKSISKWQEKGRKYIHVSSQENRWNMSKIKIVISEFWANWTKHNQPGYEHIMMRDIICIKERKKAKKLNKVSKSKLSNSRHIGISTLNLRVLEARNFHIRKGKTNRLPVHAR